jgi:hypothetical protein
VLLHIGLAVKGCEPAVETVGVVGLRVNPVRATATVISVLLSFVTPPSVALTKIPTVPEALPALNVTE